MAVLSKDKINELLSTSNHEERLVITPILDKEKQIGLCTIDLRLGTRFKVDMKTREAYVDPLNDKRPIDTFFDHTYRDFGQKFLIYPGQLVVASTFEYIRLPKNLFGLLVTRSSWNRLGLSISSIIQPGYAGVLTIELMNNSSNPIAVYPGLRFVQLFLYPVDGETRLEGYISHSVSKYIANAEPRISNISTDHDFEILNKFTI